MKPVFGIDITQNKKNERMDGSVFRVAAVPYRQGRDMDDVAEGAEELLDRAKLPMPLRVVKWIAGVGGLLLGGALVKALVDIPFEQAYENAPSLIWATGGLLAVFGVLWLWERQRSKRVLASEDAEKVTAQIEDAAARAKEELGIPQNAREVDLIAFRYVLKNGEPIPKSSGLEMTAYKNPESYLFVEDGVLYLSDLREKYAFPLSALKGIRTVKKRISIASWNKSVPPQSGIYKQYKLTVNDYGCVFMKEYHILELEHEGEIYGIYFPCYELPGFESATKGCFPTNESERRKR